MPKASVILPVYNAEKFIGEAVESILCQSFKDIEIIILNDGSTDASLEVIQKYADDKRVKIISRDNKGLAFTLNEGISMADSPWIVRMDADDIAMSHRIETQLAFVECKKIDVAGSYIQKFGDSEKLFEYPFDDISIKANMFFWKKTLCHPAAIINRQVLEKIKYDEALRVGQDTDLWIRASAIDGIKFANIQEPLLRYRKHDMQATKLFRDKQKSQRIGVLKNALCLHGFEFSDQEIELHHDYRTGVRIKSKEMSNIYTEFLIRLEALFIRKFGNGDPIMRLRRRFLLRHFLRIA
jgi:glycosyltransferase involved in cell wall biosynthesis